MPFTRHHNLDLSIHADGDDYDVILDGPSGEFHGSFSMPFAPFEVEAFVLKLGSRPGVRRAAPAVDKVTVFEFGKRLFDALFHGEVRLGFLDSKRQAEDEDHGVRIRLRLRDAPELAALPWEYMYDELGATPIALSTQTPLVRYMDKARPVQSLEVAPPLRILAVMSSPRGVEALDTTGEYQDLQESLRQQVVDGRIEVHGLHRATPSRLRDQLGKRAFHIVHFMGHGGFDESTGTGMVLLEDDQGAPLPFSGHDLGLLIQDHMDLRMVVLNACEGGRGSHTDPVGGVAQSMVHHDIPAVVGMQAEVADTAAMCFSEAFYRQIGRAVPVDVAMAEARLEMYTQGHTPEWGIPILYLRSDDGTIFDLVDEPAPADVAVLESRAGDRLADDTESGKIEALGIYQRLSDLDPPPDGVEQKLATLNQDAALVPDTDRASEPGPADEAPEAGDAPAPPAAHAVAPDVQPEGVSTPARSARMITRAETVIEQSRPLLDETGRASATGLGKALHEPLRIAIAGQRTTGKSTLVNALVGHQVAATGPDGPTQVVTWYRFGDRDHAQLVLRGGGVRDVELPAGRPPAELPAPPEEIERLDVWLSARALRRHTLIDTPGLDSLEPLSRQASEHALLGRSTGLDGEPISADALLYVFRQVALRDELEWLDRQLDTGGVLGSGAVTTIGVFSHADLAGDGPWGERDPVQVARGAARELAESVPHRAADVVAVSGLMAQAARTGRMSDSDARMLARMANLPRAQLEDGPPAPPPGAATGDVEEFVERCGAYVLARGRDEATAGRSALAAWIDRRSGSSTLEGTIRRCFLERAAALKSDHALTLLADVASRHAGDDPTAEPDVLASIEHARMHRDLHPIRELVALRQVSGIDPDLHRELCRVSGGGSIPERLGADPSASVDELVHRAQRAAAQAQRAVGLAVDGRARSAARILSTSYRLLAEEAGALQAHTASQAAG